MLFEVLTLLVTGVIIIIYYVSQRKFSYWKDRNIPYLKPFPILGNYGPYITQTKNMAQTAQELCKKFPNVPYFGAFYGTEPALIVKDPEIVKTVMTKDFYYFSSREVSNYTHKETVTKNVFFTYGDRWKVLRQNLTPLFSSSKMKKMFYLIENCCHTFECMIDRNVKVNDEQEIRTLMAQFTLDSIGNCAFGIDTKTMVQDTVSNPFFTMGQLLFKETYLRGFLIVLRAIWPSIFYGLGMKSFPKKVDDFFTELMTGVFKERQYKPSERNDFVDLILGWKQVSSITGDSMRNMKGEDKKVTLEVDDELLVAQCMVFFAAGFETSSTTLQYTLYELAKKPDIQEKVIKEVDEYLLRHNNKVGYECVTELPYTEACVEEALRLYPVLGILTREVVDDYTLPCGAVIGKGMRIHIPVHHLHHNPKFFPQPEEYRPERFYGEEKRNIVNYSYVPFGEGPRICIGMRFAKMQMFAGLVTLLKKYRVELAPRTPRDLKFSATTLVTQPKQLIYLKLVQRDGWEQRMYKH